MVFHVVYKHAGTTFFRFCHKSRLTDGQTDRILIARSHLHSMLRYKKMAIISWTPKACHGGDAYQRIVKHIVLFILNFYSAITIIKSCFLWVSIYFYTV